MIPSYPFSAIVGHDRLRLALLLCAVRPEIGGVLIRGEKGTAKSTAVRALARLLPEIDMVEACHYSCEPPVGSDGEAGLCVDCTERLARGGAEGPAPRGFHGIGDPVAGQHRRVQPLDHGHPGHRRARRPRRLQPAAQRGRERVPSRAHATSGRHLPDVLQHVAQPRRLQANDTRRGGGSPRDRGHLLVRHRAHLARGLGHDHVRGEGGEALLIEEVERPAGGVDAAHLVVEPRRGQRRVDASPSEGRQGSDVGGEVAAVRAAHERFTQAEGAHDLGRRGQEARDPHECFVSEVM